jgi:arsenite oxidase small subunit
MVNRRNFIKVSVSGVAGVVLPTVPVTVTAAENASEDTVYPILDVASLSDIKAGTVLQFFYPDEASPSVLIRLEESGLNGVGPNNEIVAYSQMCTHKGCAVRYRSKRKMLICPCHWSTFDPSRAGTMVIGQASQSLPQIVLRVKDDIVQAIGINGLIYGRRTNIV